jgi:hypothetical protein
MFFLGVLIEHAGYRRNGRRGQQFREIVKNLHWLDLNYWTLGCKPGHRPQCPRRGRLREAMSSCPNREKSQCPIPLPRTFFCRAYRRPTGLCSVRTSRRLGGHCEEQHVAPYTAPQCPCFPRTDDAHRRRQRPFHHRGAPSAMAINGCRPRRWTGPALTHEFLSMMLGVQRPGVTVAMQDLERRGVLGRRRGMVTILDREALERLTNGRSGQLGWRLSTSTLGQERTCRGSACRSGSGHLADFVRYGSR